MNISVKTTCCEKGKEFLQWISNDPDLDLNAFAIDVSGSYPDPSWEPINYCPFCGKSLPVFITRDLPEKQAKVEEPNQGFDHLDAAVAECLQRYQSKDWFKKLDTVQVGAEYVIHIFYDKSCFDALGGDLVISRTVAGIPVHLVAFESKAMTK